MKFMGRSVVMTVDDYRDLAMRATEHITPMGKTKAELQDLVRDLKMQCDVLAAKYGTCRAIIQETMWMARRYADNRCSYSTSMFNRALDLALKLDIKIHDDVTLDGRIYANDGMFGTWDPERQTFRNDKRKMDEPT